MVKARIFFIIISSNWMFAGTCLTSMVKHIYLFYYYYYYFFSHINSIIVETANTAHCALLETGAFHS